jgi:4-nitrophenyl phosphatase
MDKMNEKKSKFVTSPEIARQLLEKIDYVLLDVDGVLISGSKVLPGVPEALNQLRRLGKKLRVVTNNSTKPVSALEKLFSSLGIPFAKEEIINSGGATAHWLANIAPTKPLEKGNCFVLGSPGLVQDIQAVMPKDRFVYGPELHPDRNLNHPFNKLIKTTNLTAVGECVYRRLLPPPDKLLGGTGETDTNQSIDSLNISCVVVGLDLSLTLTKLCIANLCLRHPKRECLFIATNSDPQFPVTIHGKQPGDTATTFLPGSGTVVSSLEIAAGRKPDHEIGKPHRYMFDVIANREIKKYNLPLTPDEFAGKCLMIGDRLTTDIMFGKNAGMRTCHVFTGCEKREDIENTGIIPDFCADSLGVIGKLLKAVSAVSKL